LNCKVIGISRDNPKSHKSFAKHHNLPYTLLSDSGNKVKNLFGVKSVIPGVLPGRKTFLINLEGKISHIFEYQFKPKKHVLESLLALEV
jgi:peroxiredoxin Q/BCP